MSRQVGSAGGSEVMWYKRFFRRLQERQHIREFELSEVRLMLSEERQLSSGQEDSYKCSGEQQRCTHPLLVLMPVIRQARQQHKTPRQHQSELRSHRLRLGWYPLLQRLLNGIRRLL